MGANRFCFHSKVAVTFLRDAQTFCGSQEHPKSPADVFAICFMNG
jgi:hypothetical protein